VLKFAGGNARASTNTAVEENKNDDLRERLAMMEKIAKLEADSA